MKTEKITLCALALIVSGALATLAASPKAKSPPPAGGTNYVLNAQFTNNPPAIGSVGGIPAPAMTKLRSHRYGVTLTDGSGKITGVENVTATNLTNFGPFVQGSYIVDVIGAMGSVKSNATVMLTLKGNGYAQDALGSTQAASTLNIGFASTGGITSVTNAVSPTNDIIVLSTNRSGVVSSNYYHFLPSTNMQIYPNYQILTFITEESRLYTNGPTSIALTNIVHSDSYPFGPTLSTNGEYVFTPANATNQFTNVIIANNIDFQSVGTNTSGSNTNPVYGLDFSQVPGFISAYLANNVFTNTAATNFREVSLVASLSTNFTAGYAYSYFPAYTNTFITNNLPVLSNHWYQIEGSFKGGLTAGKFEYSLDKELATLYPRHTVYGSLFYGSGSNSNLISQFGGPAPASDSGVLYIGKQCFDGCGLKVSLENYFQAKVVQFGKSQYFSADGFYGTGAIDPVHDTYKDLLKGVGPDAGSSLFLNGSVGPLILDYFSLTNIYNLTNMAAANNLLGANLSLTVPLYAPYTNSTLYTWYAKDDWVLTYTNMLGNTSVFTLNEFYGAAYGFPIPPLLGSNVVPNGITSVILSGKIQGQTVPKTSGYNPSALYPSVQYQF